MKVPQLFFVDQRETVIQQHQLKEAVLTKGPASIPRFRAHKWFYQVRGVNSVRITFHHYDSEQHKRLVFF